MGKLSSSLNNVANRTEHKIGINAMLDLDSMETFEQSENLHRLPTNQVHPDPNQPRVKRNTDKFKSLCASVEHDGGNHSPIKVIPHPDKRGEYMIVFGHGRHLACAKANVPVLAIIQTQEMTDIETLKEQLTENDSHDQLTTIDLANAVVRLLDLDVKQKAITQMLGCPKARVSKLAKIGNASDEIKALEGVGLSLIHI